MNQRTFFITGATGLVGASILRRLVDAAPDATIYVLVRTQARWDALAETYPRSRVRPVMGDVAKPRCGLKPHVLGLLCGRVTHVLHAAADTSFTQEWADAYAVNSMGCSHVVEIARAMPRLERFIQVSTAFAAGTETGIIEERAYDVAGFVNTYERSKHVAESVVRASGLPWTIARVGLIACDDIDGRITQLNSLHRGLSLIQAGLVPALPGTYDTPLDLVTLDFVTTALEHLLLRSSAHHKTLHLCAGRNAMRVGDVIGTAFRVWSRSAAWRSHGIQAPCFVPLEDYQRLQQMWSTSGDSLLRRAAIALAPFVGQLAFPKLFDTSVADEVLGYGAEPVREYWHRAVQNIPVVSPVSAHERSPSAHRGLRLQAS